MVEFGSTTNRLGPRLARFLNPLRSIVPDASRISLGSNYGSSSRLVTRNRLRNSLERPCLATTENEHDSATFVGDRISSRAGHNH
jgi:hypothetical protein